AAMAPGLGQFRIEREEINLANNISILRKALGEGVNGQRFIETKPVAANAARAVGDQQVTCKMALVSSEFSCSVCIASAVGRTSRSIPRAPASRSTSSITGNLPYAPVPTTSRRHFHGIFSSVESGVGLNSSRNFFETLFRRL